MLIPRVTIKEEQYGPCNHEPDTAVKIDSNLCAVRSGNKDRIAGCGSCKSPFRLCGNCIRLNRRRLVSQPPTGSGLCQECESGGVRVIRKPEPEDSAPADRTVRIHTNRRYRGRSEVLPEPDKEPDRADKDSSAQSGEENNARSPSAGAAQQADFDAPIPGTDWQSIAKRYQLSKKDRSIEPPPLFERVNAISNMKSLQMPAYEIARAFGEADVQWVTVMYGLRRIKQSVRRFVDESAPTAERLSVAQAYKISLKETADQQEALARKLLAIMEAAAKASSVSKPDITVWREFIDSYLEAKKNRTHSCAFSVVVRTLTEMERAGISRHAIATAIKEKYTWVTHVLNLRSMTPEAWQIFESEGSADVRDSWSMRKLLEVAVRLPEQQVSYLQSLLHEKRSRVLRAVFSDVDSIQKSVDKLSLTLGTLLRVNPDALNHPTAPGELHSRLQALVTGIEAIVAVIPEAE